MIPVAYLKGYSTKKSKGESKKESKERQGRSKVFSANEAGEGNSANRSRIKNLKEMQS